jgi:hypothetical protein
VFYEEKNRDFNGYNGAGRRNRAAVTGEQDLKRGGISWYYVVMHKAKKR